MTESSALNFCMVMRIQQTNTSSANLSENHHATTLLHIHSSPCTRVPNMPPFPPKREV